MTLRAEDIDWQKCDGLIPAVVQHSVTGRVLMLAYMNPEAVEKTRSSKLVTFYSRSRHCLWTKGTTSGNELELRDIELDCDGDTLLVQAKPTGPTCHLGNSSCFDRDCARAGFGFVGQLEAIMSDRAKHRPDESYTAQLMRAGTQRIAQKIGEEGVEVALAAMTGNRDEIVAEAADLVYHVLVLLKNQGLSFEIVAHELESRHIN
jgi:phosphoribosyl-AMP cyclohydrolase / phosphoribosyl-ATP pyrophosphohydrolase